MARKYIRYTIEDVRESFEKEGYTLLPKEYKNCNSYLDYICLQGHQHKITYYHWLKGHRCPYCAGVVKHTIEEVKNSFASEGYLLLSTEYKNNKQKLDYICNKGHKHSISYMGWLSKQRCLLCVNINKAGSNSYMWKGGVRKLNLPLYDTYAHQIDFAEDVGFFINKDNLKILEVRCSKCRTWFTPITKLVRHRIACLNGRSKGESRFYCSQGCKNTCEVYGKKSTYYANLDRSKSIDFPYTSEELSIWSQEVLSCHNHECEICGAKENLHAHHIQPKKLAPDLALDPDNGICLCETCHYAHGHKDDCSTGALASKQCK